MRYYFFFLIAVLVTCTDKESETKIIDNNMETLFNEFDKSPQHPYGRLNPKAPTQTDQFDFMVGKFICSDSMLIDGEWKVSQAIWETSYILNGYGVKDTYRNNWYAGTSIRFFQTKKQKWEVYFFGMPDEDTGLWEGTQVDGKMVMQQKRIGADGENLMSQLTFFNITPTSFDWKGELVNLDNNTSTVFWRISAKRE